MYHFLCLQTGHFYYGLYEQNPVLMQLIADENTNESHFRSTLHGKSTLLRLPVLLSMNAVARGEQVIVAANPGLDLRYCLFDWVEIRRVRGQENNANT